MINTKTIYYNVNVWMTGQVRKLCLHLSRTRQSLLLLVDGQRCWQVDTVTSYHLEAASSLTRHAPLVTVINDPLTVLRLRPCCGSVATRDKLLFILRKLFHRKLIKREFLFSTEVNRYCNLLPSLNILTLLAFRMSASVRLICNI